MIENMERYIKKQQIIPYLRRIIYLFNGMDIHAFQLDDINNENNAKHFSFILMDCNDSNIKHDENK